MVSTSVVWAMTDDDVEINFGKLNFASDELAIYLVMIVKYVCTECGVGLQ
jgi:hypothetical protein